jgi:hypothetical protein
MLTRLALNDNMIIEQQLAALGERKLPESPRLIGGFFIKYPW